jgi:hypothetical protein
MGRRPIITVLIAIAAVAVLAYLIITTMFGPGIPDEGTGVVTSVETGYAVVDVDGVRVEMTAGVLELEAGRRVEYDSDEPGAFGLFRHYHVIATLPEE